MRENLILIGGGGHCRACIDVIEQSGNYRITGILDETVPRQGGQVFGYDVIGDDSLIGQLAAASNCFLITVGQIKSSDARHRLYQRVKDNGGSFARIISPMAYVSGHAFIGTGTIVMHGAIVNAGARVGNNCIINTNSLVEHDVNIGSHSHVSTGAVINGGTDIGTHTFIGSRAVIREGIKVGRQVVIGSGVSVFKDIPDRTLLKG